MDHAIADLFGCPTVLEPFNNPSAQIGMLDQLALPRTPIRCHQMCRRAIVAIAFGHTFIGKIIAFQFSEYCRATPFENARHLIDRDLSMSPAFYSASFRDTQLRVNGSHTDSSRQITCCILTRVAVGSSGRLSQHLLQPSRNVTGFAKQECHQKR